jgi:phosphoglycerol transferase MdoB-like AlkP superfamily enzyme
VNDEVVFDYGIKNAFSHPKSFTYLLTINTHLPFNGAINNKITNEAEIKALPTKESLGQYCRLKEQFKAIALLLEKYPIDKLVIVGDHPAPFVNTNERDFYSKKWVPAIIIKKVL